MNLRDVMNIKMMVHSCDAHSLHVKAQHYISLMSCISNASVLLMVYLFMIALGCNVVSY